MLTWTPPPSQPGQSASLISLCHHINESTVVMSLLISPQCDSDIHVLEPEKKHKSKTKHRRFKQRQPCSEMDTGSERQMFGTFRWSRFNSVHCLTVINKSVATCLRGKRYWTLSVYLKKKHREHYTAECPGPLCVLTFLFFFGLFFFYCECFLLATWKMHDTSSAAAVLLAGMWDSCGNDNTAALEEVLCCSCWCAWISRWLICLYKCTLLCGRKLTNRSD